MTFIYFYAIIIYGFDIISIKTRVLTLYTNNLKASLTSYQLDINNTLIVVAQNIKTKNKYK